MAGSSRSDRKKGVFSDARLSIAKAYVFPRKHRLLSFGLAGLLAVVVWFGVDRWLGHSRFISGGPLSSAHAGIETNCTYCHVPARAVTDAKCSSCHERTGDALGVYSPAAHAVYRSGDATRAAFIGKTGHVLACADCHIDHRGRDAMLTQVNDRQCVGCHDFGTFNRNHPEFQFARDSIPDASTLLFTHRQHVELVKEGMPSATVEQACLYCHTPEPDGRGFQPLEFDRHCAQCHLTPDEPRTFLEVLDAADPMRPGVETLEMIRARGGPGRVWASYANPAEFTRRGDKVAKSPLYHEDAWVLDNLRRLRAAMDGDRGLADLLPYAAGDANARTLYTEALGTLDVWALGLRARPEPEIASELRWIDSLLAVARRRVGTLPASARDPSFGLDAQSRGTSADPRRDAIEDLAARLTSSCTKCHVVKDASILRVQADQSTLLRVEFDHRAHLLDRRCLDCHDAIPITDAMLAGRDFTPALDTAAIQNLPRIESCRECHAPRASANRCTTCHVYHSNKLERANLLLFEPAAN